MYRELFELISTPGLDRMTQTVFTSLFESPSLSKAILNQIWYAVTKSSSITSRHEFYKCLALMALVQQGKPVDERLLENYVNRGREREKVDADQRGWDLELPSPTLDSRTELGDRLVRLLRADQTQTNLCFRYNDLCSLDTIQVDLAAAKKGQCSGLLSLSLSSSRLFRRHSPASRIRNQQSGRVHFSLSPSSHPSSISSVTGTKSRVVTMNSSPWTICWMLSIPIGSFPRYHRRNPSTVCSSLPESRLALLEVI